jgi:branched-chain amino acid transport system substrate-binding protein
MDTIFISDDGVKDDTFIKVAGKYAEGVYATGPKDVSKNPWPLPPTGPQKSLQIRSRRILPECLSAAIALLNAIENAGSTDYDAIVNAADQTVDTPLGSIRFDERGDAIGVGFSMYQVKNGQYVELK